MSIRIPLLHTYKRSSRRLFRIKDSKTTAQVGRSHLRLAPKACEFCMLEGWVGLKSTACVRAFGGRGPVRMRRVVVKGKSEFLLYTRACEREGGEEWHKQSAWRGQILTIVAILIVLLAVLACLLGCDFWFLNKKKVILFLQNCNPLPLHLPCVFTPEWSLLFYLFLLFWRICFLFLSSFLFLTFPIITIFLSSFL